MGLKRFETFVDEGNHLVYRHKNELSLLEEGSERLGKAEILKTYLATSKGRVYNEYHLPIDQIPDRANAISVSNRLHGFMGVTFLHEERE